MPYRNVKEYLLAVKMAALMRLVIAYFVILHEILQAQSLDLSPKGKRTCITKNKEEGHCIDPVLCNQDTYTFEAGGNIDDAFRSADSCPRGLWCCAGVMSTSTSTSTTEKAKVKTSDNCLAPDSDVCPWCVLLYNVADINQKAAFPYCMGAMIGSRLIITASACIKAAQKKELYARVPESGDPGMNYTVKLRHLHPEYVSGTRENDYGILVLEEDVQYKPGQTGGACLDFTAPQGTCLAYGFDIDGNIVSTTLNVVKNSCTSRGDSKDAACGSKDDDVCVVVHGSPVLCFGNMNRLYVRGIARDACSKDDKVLLGDITDARAWFEGHFQSMDIPENAYL